MIPINFHSVHPSMFCNSLYTVICNKSILIILSTLHLLFIWFTELFWLFIYYVYMSDILAFSQSGKVHLQVEA